MLQHHLRLCSQTQLVASEPALPQLNLIEQQAKAFALRCMALASRRSCRMLCRHMLGSLSCCSALGLMDSGSLIGLLQARWQPLIHLALFCCTGADGLRIVDWPAAVMMANSHLSNWKWTLCPVPLQCRMCVWAGGVGGSWAGNRDDRGDLGTAAGITIMRHMLCSCSRQQKGSDQESACRTRICSGLLRC